MTETEVYTNFRRILVEPYWCEGDPLRWEIDGVGIAHFARTLRPGMFNLAWWLLQRREPPQDASVYRNTPLHWVIVRSPKVMLTPIYSMPAVASFLTLEQWRELLRKLDLAKYPQIDGYGVTREMMRGFL